MARKDQPKPTPPKLQSATSSDPAPARADLSRVRRVERKSLLDLKGELTPSQYRRISRAMDLLLERPGKSARGRKVDPRLRSAWIEWELAAPGKRIDLTTEAPRVVRGKRPTYWQLAKKHYGHGNRYRETVKRGITRLHRHLEEDDERVRRINELLSGPAHRKPSPC